MLFGLLAAGTVFVGGGVGVGAGASGSGIALSLDLTLELQRFIVLGSMQYANLSDADVGLVSLRMGFLLFDGPTAPYLALGLGRLSETLYTQSDCVGPGSSDCASYQGSGSAMVIEAGVLLFRDDRVGRVAFTGQLVTPLTSLFSGSASFVLAGVRFQL